MRVVVVRPHCHPLLNALGLFVLLPVWLVAGVGWLYWQLFKLVAWLIRLAVIGAALATAWLVAQRQERSD